MCPAQVPRMICILGKGCSLRRQIAMTKTKLFRRIRRTAIAGSCILSLLAGTAVYADDEIAFDDGSIDTSGTTGSVDAGESTSSDSAFLIEDTGQDVAYEAGVPMDTLQNAAEAGDTDTLKKIASLGALTGSPTSGSAKSGISSSGAYRGENTGDEDIDPEDYYNLEDLELDKGDADEVETEAFNESPGRLLAASSERLQEHLDYMTQVESPTGSEGELTVAAYIEAKMDELGYTVQEQAFHEGVLNEDGVDAPGVNILAERGANSQTNRKQDIFLAVTHYDSKRSPAEGDPFANDKSGAAALIEVARILSEVVTDTDICFVFLSGEEDGGYGAQNFIASLSDENRARITGVLTVERVGYDSDTPYVLRTMTGESNALGDIIQQLGILNDAHIALTEESDEDDGTWVGVGQSSDGYIDEATSAEIAAEASGEAASSGSDVILDTATEEMVLDEPETEGEPVPMPSAWSYLKDTSPALATFANQSLTTVAVSQYMPDLDSQRYEETKALGLADTTFDTVNQVQAYVEAQAAEGYVDSAIEVQDSVLTGSADDSMEIAEDGSAPADPAAAQPDAITEEEYLNMPMVDAILVADTANVIAATLARIMDPAS